MIERKLRLYLLLALASGLACLGTLRAATTTATPADTVLDLAGKRTGICLDLGCGDGRLALEIASRSALSVYCVDPDPKVVEQVRGAAGDAGLYGLRVVAHQGSLARLAYPDYCASLVVCGDGFRALGRDGNLTEVLRILNPNGIAVLGQSAAAGGPKLTRESLEERLRAAGIADFKIIEQNGLWAIFTRPRPADWDEWSHRNHDPANTYGSSAPLAGPPYRLLWNSESTPALAASSVLLAGGRQVLVGPEYSGRAEITPSIHVLDAFTGIELWRKTGRKELPIDRPLKYYSPEKSSCDLAAAGDSLYVLGGKTCAVFDLRDGTVAKQFPIPPEAGAAEEDIWLWLAVAGDVLYGAIGSPPRHPRTTWYTMFRRGEARAVFALDRATGRELWTVNIPAFANSLALGDGRLYLWDLKHTLRALELRTGAELWARPTGFPAETAVTLTTLYRDKLWVLCSSAGHYGLNRKELAVFSAESGAPLFRKPEGPFEKDKAFSSLTFSGGKVYGHPQHGRGLQLVLDAETGKELGPSRFGDKCTPRLATPNMLLGRVSKGPLGGGPAILDLAKGETFVFEGLRPTCWYPMIPAYGLLYMQAAGCRCNFPFRGNLAMISGAPPAPDKSERLVTGPALDRQVVGADDPHPWSSWRGGASRSGITGAAGPELLERKWTAEFPARLTPLAAAGGMIFAGSEDHRILGLDAATGTVRWQYTTAGAVRSAPYWWEGRVFAGDDDGWGYALIADTGELAWKFRVAPAVERIVNRGRLSSRWPAQFGPVVREEVAYFAAGFSPPDKTWIMALDAKNGKPIWETAHLFGGRGHLAASGDTLFVPSWGAPLPVDLRNPEKVPAVGISRQSPLKGDIAVFDGAPVAALSDFTVIQDTSQWTEYRAGLPLVTQERVYLRDGRTLTAENRDALALKRGVFDPLKRAGASPRWSAWNGTAMSAAIKAGEVLYSGSDGRLHATAAADGRELWRVDVPGAVRDLAFNGGTLLVLCEPASLLAFEAEAFIDNER